MATAWSDVIQLVALVEGQDDQGFPDIVPGEPRQVFANKKSIGSQQYFLAKQSGVELSLMFEVRSVDYDGEERVVFEDKEHEVERTFEKGEFIELVCKRPGDDHG